MFFSFSFLFLKAQLKRKNRSDVRQLTPSWSIWPRIWKTWHKYDWLTAWVGPVVHCACVFVRVCLLTECVWGWCLCYLNIFLTGENIKLLNRACRHASFSPSPSRKASYALLPGGCIFASYLGRCSRQTSFLIYRKPNSCFDSFDLGVAGSVRHFCNLLRRFLQPVSALKGPAFET